MTGEYHFKEFCDKCGQRLYAWGQLGRQLICQCAQWVRRYGPPVASIPSIVGIAGMALPENIHPSASPPAIVQDHTGRWDIPEQPHPPDGHRIRCHGWDALSQGYGCRYSAPMHAVPGAPHQWYLHQ